MSLRDLLLKKASLNGVFSSSISEDPFEIAIATVLSQNTSDLNAIKAFNLMRDTLSGKITPRKIISLSQNELERLISPSGLKRAKARTIRNLAEAVIKRWEGDMRNLLKEDNPREALLSIKGIGFKTADVILLHLGYENTFAIDRHIGRILKRFGIAEQKDGYEFMKVKLMELFPPGERLRAHKLLISIGRRFCRPRNPECGSCPLREECRKYS
ncbi:MAG: endonuclease III [Synergistetes bacterium]|nr:endonuclease III [Synergistota bacterium]